MCSAFMFNLVRCLRSFFSHFFRADLKGASLGRAAHLAGRISLGLGILQRHWDLAGRQVSAPVAVIALAGARDVNGLGLSFFGTLRGWLLSAERQRLHDRRERQ